MSISILKNLKENLSRVFDDDLKTRQWQNYLDYVIIGFIVLSTIQIFLSTFDGVVEKYGTILNIVDWLTTIVFTIEVTLRIWCADLIDERYKGFLGRLRYCFSFYGLMDILSTYTFYLALFVNVPYTTFKVLRVARLFRVFRYIKAFNVLARAIKSKKDEMIVSLEFLFIVTIMLSFVLYFVEHEMQPEVYDNGLVSVLWAFMQYIGDPGGFADTPPVTVTGRVIASIIGVLGIAIFAVPAGLVGSAFSEVMEEDQREEDCKKWSENLLKSFERKLDRYTGYQIAPKYVSVPEIQARMGMKEDDIFDAVSYSSQFRLINLAFTQPAEQHPVDKLAVEYVPLNTPYGCCIDRGSKVTITALSNVVDPIAGWWGYYLALIGGFNYISKETGSARPYKSFYIIKGEYTEHQAMFMDDINRVLDDQDKWVFNILPASGSQEPELPEQFHFTYGAKKGDQTYDDPNITLNDIESFEAFYQEFASLLNDSYKLQAEKQLRHNNSNPGYYARHLANKVNAISLRVAWSVMCWDMRSIQIAEELARCINHNINHCENPSVPCLKTKDFAYNGY